VASGIEARNAMHVFLFDIDGTLIRSGGAGRIAFEGAIVSLFGTPDRLPEVAFTGRTDRAIAGDLFEHFGVANSTENWRDFQKEYLRRLPATLAERAGRVLPGVAALLDRLARRSGVAVGLLTGNMQEGARTKLRHYGLWQYFAYGAFGDEHFGRDDVARDALRYSERHVGRPIDAHRVWVVGDTPHDVACARAVGAQAVAVATGTHTREELALCEPDLLLDDLSDPSEMFDAIR
jgi:phosphoglycolate phosphatase-like HAD superfamily hydrolase